MRPVPIAAFLVLILPFTNLASEEPKQAPKDPDAGRIDLLIQQLDSADYATREQASAQLMAIGLAAKKKLVAARQSETAEVRQRAEQLLRAIEGLEEQEAFLAAMKGSWPEGLKDGRLTGPLLGAARLNSSPASVDLSAFSVETPPGADNPDAYFPRSLWFLSRAQEKDGAWPARALGAEVNARAAQTAFVLWAFLASGHTEKVGMFKANLQRGIAWLRAHQREDGAILDEGWTQVDYLTQALVAVTLSGAADMAEVEETRTAAQRAVKFLLQGQDNSSGGFGRRPDVGADLLTTTFCILAIKSAKLARLDVPVQTFEGAVRFLDSVEEKDSKSYRYVPGGKTSPNAAIAGLLSRQMLGWKKEDLAESAAVAFAALGEPSLDKDSSDALTNCLTTLVAIEQGGEVWNRWKEALKRQYTDEQAKGGGARGAWTSKGVWGGGGYGLSSALGCLNMAIFFRYMPVFRKNLNNR